MKKALFLSIILFATMGFAEKIQRQGIKTAAECVAAGSTAANCLPQDSQIWVSSVVPAQQLSTAITAGLIGGGGGNTGKNYLSNAGFEGGATSWTVSGASSAANTSDYHDGAQALTITPSGAGSILQSPTPAPNLFGSNLESGAWVKTTKTDVEVCALAAGSEIACQAVPATGQWVYVPVNQAGPAQGTSIGVKVKWASTGGSVIVDQAYVGGATNLTAIAQAFHIGTLKYTAIANCAWIVSSTTYTSFADDSDCGTPTVTGNLIAPATKIPAFKMNVASGSKYRITAKGYFNQFGGNYTGMFRFTDGTNPTELATATVYTPAKEGVTGVASAIYEPTTSGQKTIEFQAKSDFGNGTRIDNSVVDLVFEVEQFPSQSQLAVNSLQADTEWASYTPTFTGFGTVSTSNIRWKKVGSDVLIDGTFVTGSVSGVEARISLPNGIVSSSALPALSAAGLFSPGGASAQALYTLKEPSVSYITIGSQGSATNLLAKLTGTGAAYASNTVTVSALVPIEGWYSSQKSPILVGSVTSNSDSATRVESGIFAGASINANCTSNPCTLYGATKGVVVNRASTGVYQLNFTPAFSAPPSCTFTMGSTTYGDVTAMNTYLDAPNTAYFPVSVLRTSTGATPDGFGSFHCTAAK